MTTAVKSHLIPGCDTSLSQLCAFLAKRLWPLASGKGIEGREGRRSSLHDIYAVANAY